eukprot:c4277_g1_i1.p1 GENE.c4277_g1_i1~~c4277_g1_i1.p1  ORF type:complete len:1130 (+),score=294.46 c4277_g1_i1:451-3390(+)
MPKGSDVGFVQSVYKNNKRFKKLQEPKMKAMPQGAGGTNAPKSVNKDEAFVIRHFAGDVCYSLEGFLDKNNDTLQQDLLLAVMQSKSAFLLELFPEHKELAADKMKGTRFASVSNKFSTQLESLMEVLHATSSHFIRCIKPNPQQKPNLYDRFSVMTQLRCSGMLDALRLMHEGFPTRCPYDDLYERYRLFMPPTVAGLDSTSFTEALLMALEIDQEEYQLGITRVFFRAGKLAFLDDLTGADYETIAPDIAEKVRRWLVKKRWKRAIVSSMAHVKINRRLEQLKAFRKLQQCATMVFYINSTWFKLLKKIRLNNAATLIQKVSRSHFEQKKFQMVQKKVVVLQKVAKARVYYSLNQPKIKAAIAERKRMESEMAEAQRRSMEEAKRSAQERAKNKQDARKRGVEEDKASKAMAVPGKSVLDCDLLLSTDVALTEYHKLSNINLFKEVLADVLQVKDAEVFILSVKGGEGTIILMTRIVIDTELEEEKADIFRTGVADNILSQSLTHKGLATSSVSFSGKLSCTPVTSEGASYTTSVPVPSGEGESDDREQMMLQHMQMQQRTGTNEIKDARLELRLRTLERETKDLKKQLETEREEREKLEKLVKDMQKQMLKHLTLIMQSSAQLDPTRRVAATAAAPGGVTANPGNPQSASVTTLPPTQRVAPSRVVPQQAPAPVPHVSTQNAPVFQQPHLPAPPPAQHQPHPPAAPVPLGTRSQSQSLLMTTTAPVTTRSPSASFSSAISGQSDDDLIKHSQNMLEQNSKPAGPQSAFDIISALRTAKPKPPVQQPESQQLNMVPIKRLQTAVSRCSQHFAQAVPGVGRNSLGNDAANRDIGRLVRGELCTALAMILLNGFKSFKFMGRYHLWDFFDKCVEFKDSPNRAKVSIADGVFAVKAMEEYMKGKNDLKFRALVCYALNHRALHVWITALDADDQLVQKWFEPWGFLRSDMAREMIINTLEPLAHEKFELALDYELAMWDL